MPGVLVAAPWTPSDFCHMCGSPFPWASRQARIYELQNILDEQDLDEATRLEVSEQLEALATQDLNEEEQVERWQKVRELSPALFESGRKIMESVMTAAIKASMDL